MSENKETRDWLARMVEPLKLKEPQIKQIRQLLALGLTGLFLILTYNVLTTAGKNTPRVPVGATPVTAIAQGQEPVSLVDTRLSQVLSDRLSGIQGAGHVDVTVTLESSEEKVYSQNSVRTSREISEKDAAGATRTTTETTDDTEAVMGRSYTQGTGEVPVVSKVIAPRVKGVVVIADGAHSVVVKANLTLAVQALLDVPANRILVLPREGSVRP